MFRWWRKIRTETGPAAINCALELSINRANGRVSLELFLANHVARTVWVEEAKVVLTGLDTSWQTSIPPGQAKREIRQHVRAHESLELSVAQAIYDAAGKPQGSYSCLICIDVRYRVGEQWFHKALDTFKVQMAGLKPRGLRRLRWRGKKQYPRRRPV